MSDPQGTEKRCTRCGATLDRCTGHAWARPPMETAVCMGFDAFRICVGKPTKHFTPAQVKQWMGSMTS